MLIEVGWKQPDLPAHQVESLPVERPETLGMTVPVPGGTGWKRNARNPGNPGHPTAERPLRVCTQGCLPSLTLPPSSAHLELLDRR